MTTLFISDLHLEEQRPDITAAFHHFIEHRAMGAEALYILGDFFEAWIGDDEHTPLQEEVAARLKRLAQAGTRLFLMHGNRDFLLGNAFCERVGASLLEDPTVIDLYGEPTLLMHGDSLCTADIEYQKFRKNMRNAAWQDAFLKRPLADRQQVARQLRQISMAQNKGKEASIMDVTPGEVAEQMSAHGVRQLIHGHTHRPAVHELEVDNKSAQRIVLGDWDSKLWYIRAAPGEAPMLLDEPLQQIA
ncbi:UDP-2,3-diacylglucosamine diphosphatase [Hydrocarboniclastica marina]|uniref:UDP-2,3-diacylglucosamine hydrolase n=1 Tax=Hydrocarboniclastica marina TaxID=2259620 RepID=A0A4P7XF96_9ALTE|nr:UDP-2,3-diacylglucosamine diphosphatase [Hydrocarboniclastica marina]MAL98644.1 UDP-2,3-diacylglucosamine diphosphatase [Alteromonadaceae bacterium]QCF25611.1 UDP-2,3-diacylglucosamine diphosphatase [Hydrocarboniclastica marina]|tara:strand:+ start:2634 stop:3371 length:738 start_codon:yes stop_codon:yes gene_type:complete